MVDREDALLAARGGRGDPACLRDERVVEAAEVDLDGRQVQQDARPSGGGP
jgi:hypothetical protein